MSKVIRDKDSSLKTARVADDAGWCCWKWVDAKTL